MESHFDFPPFYGNSLSSSKHPFTHIVHQSFPKSLRILQDLFLKSCGHVDIEVADFYKPTFAHYDLAINIRQLLSDYARYLVICRYNSLHWDQPRQILQFNIVSQRISEVTPHALTLLMCQP